MLNIKFLINRKSTKIFTFLIILILLLFFLKERTYKEKVNTAYIFQTSDIHGYLKHREDDNNGGWLRLGYIIEEEVKKSGGRDNCLLIDCGDTLQGSIEAAINRGNFAIAALNLLNYNIFVPGNHDFDYGISYFLHSISKLKADVLAANLKLGFNIPKIKAWNLYEVNNIKIAVIGMTSPYIKYWIGKKIIEQYSITSITRELSRVLPKVIEAEPNVIILALHHGLYNSKRFPGEDQLLRNIIKKFPEIDLVLGGHTHQFYSGELIYANTLFVQPGAHGSYLTKIKIIDNELGKEAPKIETELIPITSQIPLNSRLLAAVSNDLKNTDKRSQETITTLKSTIDDKGIPGKDCKIAKLFSEAIFSLTNADAVMCTVLASDKNLRGKVTYQDIYKICPYEDSIMILTLTYEELKKIFNEQSNFKSKYRKKLGLYVKVGNEIIGINSNDRFKAFLIGNLKIRIAFSSYDIAGAGNRYPVLRKIAQSNKKNLFDTNILFRDAVNKYLLSNNKSGQ